MGAQRMPMRAEGEAPEQAGILSNALEVLIRRDEKRACLSGSPPVSVVITARNSALMLRRCLESVSIRPAVQSAL